MDQSGQDHEEEVMEETNKDPILRSLDKVDNADQYASDEDDPKGKNVLAKVNEEQNHVANGEAEDNPDSQVIVDNRLRVHDASAYPFKAVCHMRMSFKTNRMVNYIGTGFLVLVDKQRFLLTAAHNVCIIQGKKRIRAGAVRLFFGRNGEAEDALPCEPIIVTGDDFEIDECFDEYMGGSDYAVLDMEPYEESLPEQVFLIDFGMPPRLEDLEIISYPAYPGEKVVQTRRIELRSAAALDDSEAEKKPVELPGFPRYTVWKAWCGFRSSASHTHLTHKNKENIGSSGGPVFYYGLNEKCYVSGIHVGYMTDIQSNMAIIANRCFPDVTEDRGKSDDEEEEVNLDFMTQAPTTNSPYVNTAQPYIGSLTLLWRYTVKNMNSVGFLPNNSVVGGVFRKALHVLSAEGKALKVMDMKVRSLITNKKGEMVIVDDLENSIKHLDDDLDVTREWGGNEFEHALGMAHSRAGHYVISDSIRRRVSVWTDKGERITSFGSGGEFSFPAYMFWDDDRNRIIVSDWDLNRVTAHDQRTGRVFTRYGSGKRGGRDGELHRPHGLCISPGGTLLIADYYNDRVCEFTPDGRFLQHVITNDDHDIWLPRALAVSPDGKRLAVTERATLQVFQINPAVKTK